MTLDNSRNQQQKIQLSETSTSRQPLPLALLGVRAFFRALGAVAPKTAGRVAGRMFLRPRRHHTPLREIRWLKRSERRDFSAGGESIATYWRGDGPVVLLVHGWEGRGGQMGAFIAPLVEAGYRAVAVDLPAHGKSSGHTTDGFACGRALRELCEAIGNVHGVVAHSFGGTAVLLAMARGLRLKRSCLISPGANQEAFFQGFAKIVGLPPLATDELRRLMHARFGEREWSVFTPEHQGPVLSAASEASLVVHDTDDVEVPYDDSVRLVRSTGRARLLTTCGAGHRRILREPQVVDAIAEFIAAD